METAAAILKELEQMGSEQTRKIFRKHGAPENMFGVKVGDMKKIVKRIKKDYVLAKELYATGNSDAMYLAGLIGDESKMTKTDLNKWAKKSSWYMISEFTVPFVAAESSHGWELALEWINSNRENVIAAGWATLSGWISIRPDEEIELNAVQTLLNIVRKDIHRSPNRVRYAMNGFVIAVGTYLTAMHEEAKKVAIAIGKVNVDVGDTSCKVPDALSSIEKSAQMNRLGRKRKSARC
jgi:3-methyladenine DNA glycosylase AlkD